MRMPSPQRSVISSSFGGVVLCVLAALLGAMAGCSKAPRPAPEPVAKVAEAAPAPAAVTETAAAVEAAEQARLFAAYHAIRCVLVGSRFAPDSLYKANGFESASAFSQAFQKAASANPAWASRAIADSYATDCKVRP